MLTLEQVIAMALKHEHVMAQLGTALSSDLVSANPFHRRIVEHAADFAVKYGRLPSTGDHTVWLETLETGMMRDGTKEALGHLYALDVSEYQPEYFAEVALAEIRKGAAQVVKARLNTTSEVTPEEVALLAEKLASLAIAQTGQARRFPTFADLMQRSASDLNVEAEAEVLVPRLAWRGRHVLLAGREKLGKSTFVGAGAVALTLGGPFLDGTAARGRVLWLAMDESTGDAFPRLIDNGAFRFHLMVLDPGDPAGELRAWLTGDPNQHPDLVVVDSLIEYARRTTHEMPASGDAGAWGAVIRPLTELAHRHDVGIATIHHARKSDGDFRDSTEIGAAVDALLTMFASAQGETVRRIRMVGRRSIVQRDSFYSVRLEQEAVEIPLSTGGVKTVQRDRYVLGLGAPAYALVKGALALMGVHIP